MVVTLLVWHLGTQALVTGLKLRTKIDLVLKVGDEDEGLLLCRELLPFVATYVFLSHKFLCPSRGWVH